MIVFLRISVAVILLVAAFLTALIGAVISQPDGVAGSAAWIPFLRHFWPTLLLVFLLLAAGWYAVPEPRSARVFGARSAPVPMTPDEERRFIFGFRAVVLSVGLCLLISLARNWHHLLADPWRMGCACCVLLDLAILVWACCHFPAWFKEGRITLLWLPLLFVSQTLGRLDEIAVHLSAGIYTFGDVLLLASPLFLFVICVLFRSRSCAP